jgi:small subunit ribosomal protein S14
MKYQVSKDKTKRAFVQKEETKRLALKYRVRDKRSTGRKRWLAGAELTRLNRKGSKVRVTNRCILTGRSKSVHRQFKISRIALRNLASMGLISGVRKSSW